ncbi:hypothetical protein Hanom_Chr01g00000281 [Helianthus anomalus]
MVSYQKLFKPPSRHLNQNPKKNTNRKTLKSNKLFQILYLFKSIIVIIWKRLAGSCSKLSFMPANISKTSFNNSGSTVFFLHGFSWVGRYSCSLKLLFGLKTVS